MLEDADEHAGVEAPNMEMAGLRKVFNLPLPYKWAVALNEM